MTFNTLKGITNRTEAKREILNRLSKTNKTHAHASVAYGTSAFDEAPEVTLYLDGNKNRYNIWVELPLGDSFEEDHVYIFDKYFENENEAIDAFFKKIEHTEAMFEVELEVWV